MRLGIATLLLVLAGCEQGVLSGAPVIPEALQGRWEATAEACRNADTMLKVEGSSLVLMGLKVEVAKATPVGADAFLIEGKAQEEAEPFDTKFTLRRTTGGLELTKESSPGPFSMVSCEPGASGEAPGVARVIIGGVVAFPEATGPVANYFRSEMPVRFQGRWVPYPAMCDPGPSIVTIDAKTIASGAVLVRLGDIEVNESRSVIIDIAAAGNFSSGGKRTDGRVNMRLSVDGTVLRVTVMGLPENGELPAELHRCS